MKIGIITRFSMPLTNEAKGYYYRLHHLADGLVKRGHQVTVLAHPQTKIKAGLVKASVINMSWETQLMTYVNFLKKHGNSFDIINAQTDHMCCFLSPFIETPILHTIIFGTPFGWIKEAFRMARGQYFSTVSQGMKKFYPSLNWQGVVYNGLDINQFEFNKHPEDYLLFLSRLNYYKGIEIAIKVAKATGNKLVIAGRYNKYFDKVIKQQLNKNIIYFGEATFKQKVKLLKNAKALLHFHLLPEGFGNSMIEAQACGTPVIAYPYGSTPEVVQDQKTGFIVKDMAGAKKAIKNIKKINRTNCRNFIETNFTLERMITGYEEIYKKVIKKYNFKHDKI